MLTMHPMFIRAVEVFEAMAKAEYALALVYADSGTCDEDYAAARQTLTEHFHHSMEAFLQPWSVRGGYMPVGSRRTRDLFLVQHFPEAKVGKELASALDGPELFLGTMSNNQTSGRPELSFNDRFAVGLVKGSPVIVYQELFMLGSWEPSHGYEPLMVLDWGPQGETQSFLEPEEDISLTAHRAATASAT